MTALYVLGRSREYDARTTIDAVHPATMKP
jgi:hypothetical protein